MTGAPLPPPEELRLLVRELLREVLATAPPRSDPFDGPSYGSGAVASPIERKPEADLAGRGGSRGVRLADDADLAAFVAEIARLAADPRRRQDLMTGRLRFTLTGTPTSHSVPIPAEARRVEAEARRGETGAGAAAGVRRVEKGAVTERTVAAAAKAGERLVLGPKAVLTPLGRDKARALGVTVEKER
jgi:hypothetical protein